MMGFFRGQPGFLLGSPEAASREMGFGGEMLKEDDEVTDGGGDASDSITHFFHKNSQAQILK